MANNGPLREVVERGPTRTGNRRRVGGWWDTLTCGHKLPYDGVDHKQRRCPHEDCANKPAPTTDGTEQAGLF